MIVLLCDGVLVMLELVGQLELFGVVLEIIYQICVEIGIYFNEVVQVVGELQLGFFGMGFQLKWKCDEMLWMLKGCYKIMCVYMFKVGLLGLDMMICICMVQVNLDYVIEVDMVKKFCVLLVLQLIVIVLFVDLLFIEGKLNGYLSYCLYIWIDIDVDCIGMFDFVFEEGFGYECYVDYLFDVLMYFFYCDGIYYDVSGQSFCDFMQGKLLVLLGVLLILCDWLDYMIIVFLEVCLKKYLEMCGVDGGLWSCLCVLLVFWVGLLYDDIVLDVVWDLVCDFILDECYVLCDGVLKYVMNLLFCNGMVCDLVWEVVRIFVEGFKCCVVCNVDGQDESKFLDVLQEIVEFGLILVECKLVLFYGCWYGDVDLVFCEFVY